MTRSGSPRPQLSGNLGEGARSAGSPSGAPASAHSSRVMISFSESRRSSRKTPWLGSGFHGGIRRLDVTSLMKSALLAASLYERSEKGPTSPGRWHPAQFFQRIGATCLLKVTDAGSAAEGSLGGGKGQPNAGVRVTAGISSARMASRAAANSRERGTSRRLPLEETRSSIRPQYRT